MDEAPVFQVNTYMVRHASLPAPLGFEKDQLAFPQFPAPYFLAIVA